ncbi:hypothetical protein Tco_1273556 [Tanacetum coccineum]
MKKVIKEQVKSKVLKIIQKIEKLVNEQLESEVLERSSKETKTSHAVAANLSELELKKILIDKMEANKSINRSFIQRQLYKALVDAYEADKILLDTYGDTITIKRPRDGADDDQEPSDGTDRGSKRRRKVEHILQYEERLAFSVSLRMFNKKCCHPKEMWKDLHLAVVEVIKRNSTHQCLNVDPHGFEGYLKMVVEVPDSS